MRIYIVILLAAVWFSVFATKSKPVQSIKSTHSQSNSDSLTSLKSSVYAKITTGTQPMKGLFAVYKKAGSYYFEIPDSLLGRDMLVASRVVSISDNSKISAGQRRSNPILISFSRRNNVLFMHQPTGKSLASETDPIAVSLAINNLVPVAMTFDIAARNSQNTASVIDVTKLFSTEFDLVFPAGMGNTGKLDAKASHIVDIKAFEKNIEIKSLYNYNGGREPFSVIVNYSFVLLSKEPYRVRHSDDRIGFSAENRRIFESGKPTTDVKFINRWRIEPRPEDVEKYKQGELVVPEKQIVFYVDTVMPLKWRGYVRQAIESWNAAFEKIGFKNVIQALDFPNSKDFDPDDIRHNCFRYVASDDANAQGPQWIDPRSGEIIQGDIIWWHNVIELLQTWRFVQTAAVDPEAREKQLSDALMGDAIRYAVAHEMGHVLGLQHNMRASYAVPTDSLRSASFTQKYGTTASIMDYSRNNYVAQPGDKEKGVVLTPPRLGIHDFFAIKWGYKPIFEATTPQDELPTLNQWFLEKGNNPFFIHAGTAVSAVVPDPSAQSDALGNDLIKSARYGIANIKLITNHLIKWTMTDGDHFELLQKRWDAITKHYFRITNLTLSYLGGAYSFNGVYGQHEAQLVPVRSAKQKETIRFVLNELVHSQWLNNSEITQFLGASTNDITQWQSNVIDNMLGNFVLTRIVSNEPLYHKHAYTLSAYLQDVDTEIWKLTAKPTLSHFDRHIQMAYVDKLCRLIEPFVLSTNKAESLQANHTVWASAVASQLVVTRAKLSQLITTQVQNSGHYRLIIRKIDQLIK